MDYKVQGFVHPEKGGVLLATQCNTCGYQESRSRFSGDLLCSTWSSLAVTMRIQAAQYCFYTAPQLWGPWRLRRHPQL